MNTVKLTVTAVSIAILSALSVTAMATATPNTQTEASSQAASKAAACQCFDVQVTGQGPALILIPGVASSAEVWQHTVDSLKDRYQLHVLTLAGFAGTKPIAMQSWGEGYLALQQAAILRYIDEQKLNKPVIIGHSLGGYLALALAAKAPDSIGGAINVDGLPALGALFAGNNAGSNSANNSANNNSSQGSANNQQGSNSAAQRFDPMAMAKSMASSEKWQQQIVKDMYRSDGMTSGRVMGELMRADLRPALSDIRVPVLTLGALQHGAPYSTPEQVQANYEQQLANAPAQYHRFAFARDAKHFIMADAPDWLQKQIEQFLQSYSKEEAASE